MRRRRTRRQPIERLERRLQLAAPAAPVIIEPFAENQTTGTFDINLQTDPELYSDADGHAWQATRWQIREQSGGAVVWDTSFLSAPPLTLYRVDFSDGAFVGPLAGKTELNYSTGYQLVVRYRDANNEISAAAVRNFTTAGPSEPVSTAGTWLVKPGYVVEPVQTGLRLPVNIAFVPNPGNNPNDPLYYVAELYGSIEVVRNNGTRSTFATGLLDYNPSGPISGAGEQGLAGLAVERDPNNPNVYNLYVSMLWDNGSPAGGPNHYPKVEKITSTTGGLTMNSRTVLLNMQPETQGQSHQISNVSLGPDNKLYVHMGDGFDASTSLNLDLYRGKILRMNKDGSPVAAGDPAGANPFYNAADGINARDYIYTYGHRNPFGGAWRAADGKHWIVENGNSLDRMVDLVAGQSYGWAGNDTTHIQFSKYVWNPATAPVNIDFIESTKFNGSGFPAEAMGHAYVTLSGSTYAAGPQQRSKAIAEFSNLDTLNASGKLAVEPSFLVKYNGTGRASISGLAAGPDGLYFTDLYEDTGVNGPTAIGANVYRVRYVGTAGGAVPTIAAPAAASPSHIILGSTTSLSVLGDDDGGESKLTYIWGTMGNPPGPVYFSNNASNDARNVTATFVANGTYNLYVAVRDEGGQLAFSNVVVTVTSILSDTGDGINGQYWSNIDFTGNTLQRIDPAIDFDFGTGGPGGQIGTNTFSARWTGFISPRFTQTYTFHTTTNDGVRLWIGNPNTPLIDAFVAQGTIMRQANIDLVAGQLYAIRMDYFEDGNTARAHLEWSSANQAREIVPRGRLYSATPGVPAAPSGLAAAAASSSRINLTWTDNSSIEAGYVIQQSTNGSNFTTIATVAANVTTFENTGLAANTHYFYRVRATNPAGDSNFAANDATTPPAIGSIAGNVWNDPNSNGIKDAGEPVLAGWTIYLDTNNNNAHDNGETSTTTDASGSYLFADLPAGTYHVKQALAAGYRKTLPGLATPGYEVTLNGNAAIDKNFANTTNIRLAGIVYNDANSNGVKDGNEVGIAGVTVNIVSNATVVATRTTDANGFWRVQGLSQGTGEAVIVLPAGYTPTAPIDAKYTGSMSAGEQNANLNFGLHAASPAPVSLAIEPAGTLGSIRGKVFNDLNSNGLNDPGEPALAGWTIYLDQTPNETLDPTEVSAVSDASGNYVFNNLPASTYRVREVLKANYRKSAPNGSAGYLVNLPRGASAIARDFGNTTNLLLAGRVYNDANNNGVQDAGEAGLAGVTLNVFSNGMSVATRTTNATGFWQIKGLSAGSGTALITVPAGFTATSPQGANYNGTMSSGQANANLNFGLRRLSPAPVMNAAATSILTARQSRLDFF